ncbi:MAG TPA: nucleotidyltransferase domain-containing protein [Candidatus Nanoarchaeia archaeon]|nr:nucleotidyltransferase domain-containing protein [Candidatus Nanoarchaeia archaeon]
MDNKLKIINYLGKNLGKYYTMHELSKLLGIPYATFYRTIPEMKDLLIIKAVGKSKTIQLNLENPITKAHLTISSDEEKKEFLQNQPIIKKIESELNSKDVVILFGSYAKKTQHEQSDIDLLIINKDGNKSIFFSKNELLFKKKINPIFVTKKEFELMLKDKEENVGKQALKSNVILKHPEEFWGYVLNAIRSGSISTDV